MDHQVKYLLDESEIPRQWYNVIPDLPAPPPPPLHPGTGQPVGPEALAPLGRQHRYVALRAVMRFTLMPAIARSCCVLDRLSRLLPR